VQPKDEDDEMGMGNMDMHAMMLVKRACELFADEFQQEISEVMYRQVNSKTAEAIAAAFCPKILEPLAPTPKKKKSGKEQKEKTKQKQKKRKNKEQKEQKEPASPNFQVFITMSHMRTKHLCIATH
jgi:outer membrane biosynthesis protein TonB